MRYLRGLVVGVLLFGFSYFLAERVLPLYGYFKDWAGTTDLFVATVMCVTIIYVVCYLALRQQYFAKHKKR